MNLGAGLSRLQNQRETRLCPSPAGAAQLADRCVWHTSPTSDHALSQPQNKPERHWVMLDLLPATSTSLHTRETQPHSEEVPVLSCHPFQERNTHRLGR